MRKIHRQCKCGCKQITNYGKKWINGHHCHLRTGKNHPLYGKHHSKDAIKKMSLIKMGNTHGKGCKLSKETKLRMSLSSFKYDPNYEYCDEWKDRKYKKDLRKDHCENVDCEGHYKLLVNHHIDLNKKHCHPSNIMTLCASCSTTLHNKLRLETMKAPNYKDYLTIIRKDRITYIHKKTRTKIILKRIEYDRLHYAVLEQVCR